METAHVLSGCCCALRAKRTCVIVVIGVPPQPYARTCVSSEVCGECNNMSALWRLWCVQCQLQAALHARWP